MDLKNYTDQAIEVVKKIAAFQLEERAKFQQDAVKVKGKNDLVSYVDVISEKMLVEGLSGIIPEAGFLTEEETTENKNENLFWIIDIPFYLLLNPLNILYIIPIYIIRI